MSKMKIKNVLCHKAHVVFADMLSPHTRRAGVPEAMAACKLCVLTSKGSHIKVYQLIGWATKTQSPIIWAWAWGRACWWSRRRMLREAFCWKEGLLLEEEYLVVFLKCDAVLMQSCLLEDTYR